MLVISWIKAQVLQYVFVLFLLCGGESHAQELLSQGTSSFCYQLNSIKLSQLVRSIWLCFWDSVVYSTKMLSGHKIHFVIFDRSTNYVLPLWKHFILKLLLIKAPANKSCTSNDVLATIEFKGQNLCDCCQLSGISSKMGTKSVFHVNLSWAI